MTKNNGLLPAYLVVGEDELKRDRVLKRLRARVSSLGDIDFNSDVFDGATCAGEDVVNACNTLPFASDVRLVVVKGVEQMKKASLDALAAYVKEPCETTVLALLATKLAKNTALYKSVAALDKQAVIDCAPLKKYELPKTVRSMAVTHGFTMNDAAAVRLVDLVGENTVRIDAELKKIALAHRGTDVVGVSEVEALVARTSEAKPWEFTDAFAARDARACMTVYRKLDSTSPHALLGMCITRLRELITCQGLISRGQGGTDNLAAKLGVQSWRVKNHATWARNWTPAELRHALVSARDAERAMKSGSDPETTFLMWALESIRR